MPGQANNVDWGTILQLSLLLMALPAQYIIMNYSSTTPHQSQKALKQYVFIHINIFNPQISIIIQIYMYFVYCHGFFYENVSSVEF